MDVGVIFASMADIANSVFGMLGAEAELVNPADSKPPPEEGACTISSIGLGGSGYEAAMTFRMADPAANAIVELMLGEEPEDDASLHDGLGELANMLAGGVKARMHEDNIDMTLGLPSVVAGRSLTCSFSAGATVYFFQIIVEGEHYIYGTFLVREKKARAN